MPQHPGANLWELSDLCTPWCIHVVATLRVANHIAAGANQIDEIAANAQCDPYALHRVLQHLVNKGVFEETRPGRFALNEAAKGLLDPAFLIGLDLTGIGGRFAYAWGSLLSYVRTGASAYHEVFGRTFWEDLEANPEIGKQFDDLIGPVGHGTPSPDFQLTGGWEAVQTVIDVGGGTGAMLAGVLRAHPHIRGTLVDLPRTVELSGEIFRAAGVADRAATAGQSFFEPLPAGADLYLLRGVINDWGDEEAAAILQRCAAAAKANGRVIVLKGISEDGAKRPLAIEMMLAGGKHRSISEFRELARKSGLEVIAAERQANYFVVECRPT
jgi:hypothetical protein